MEELHSHWLRTNETNNIFMTGSGVKFLRFSTKPSWFIPMFVMLVIRAPVRRNFWDIRNLEKGMIIWRPRLSVSQHLGSYNPTGPNMWIDLYEMLYLYVANIVWLFVWHTSTYALLLQNNNSPADEFLVMQCISPQTSPLGLIRGPPTYLFRPCLILREMPDQIMEFSKQTSVHCKLYSWCTLYNGPCALGLVIPLGSICWRVCGQTGASAVCCGDHTLFTRRFCLSFVCKFYYQLSMP